MATNKYFGHLGTLTLTSTCIPSAWYAFVDSVDDDLVRDMVECTEFSPPNGAKQYQVGLVGPKTIRIGGFCEKATYPTFTNWLSTTITDCTVTYTPVSGRTVTFVGQDVEFRTRAAVGTHVKWEISFHWDGVTAPTYQ